MFTKKEFSFVFLVLSILAVVTVINLYSSYTKSRDNERKNSMGDIVARLGEFQKLTGTFPLSQDGKIVGCDGFKDKLNRWFFKPCNWGPNELNSPVFNPLPHDPYIEKGRKFVYFSDGKIYQLYSALEGTYEDEYDKNILARNISSRKSKL